MKKCSQWESNQVRMKIEALGKIKSQLYGARDRMEVWSRQARFVQNAAVSLNELACQLRVKECVEPVKETLAYHLDIRRNRGAT